MNAARSEPRSAAGSGLGFAATHWSVVLSAGDLDPQKRIAALEVLCRTYWEPLYAFARRLGYSPHDAEDVIQGFFSHLLSHNRLAGVEAAKGKFRSFLLASLKNFMVNQHTHAQAAKRGGGQAQVPLDTTMAEVRLAQNGAMTHSPDSLYDREWALSVLKQAGAKLREELAAAGKEAHFTHLAVFLTREGNSEDYGKAGAKLGLSKEAVAVAVHRLRARWRDHVRREVAQTVDTHSALEEEMRYLLEVLCR